MKKWILIATAIVLIVIFLLPSQQTTQASFQTDVPIQVVLRTLADTTRWTRWWPGEKKDDTTYLVNEKEFIKSPVLVNGFSARQGGERPSIKITVTYQGMPGNQTGFEVRTAYLFSKDPYRKIKQYFDWFSWKKSAALFTDSLRSYFSKDQNIYGFSIRKEKVPDAHYISITASYPVEPAQESADSLVQLLRTYVDSQQASVVNQPIMHVTSDGSGYKLMVALPINRAISPGNPYQYKQMILGYILVADVQGGPGKIKQCLAAMERYMADHGQSSPAIPFQRMITDRAMVKDSSQWMTSVNYPVFQ